MHCGDIKLPKSRRLYEDPCEQYYYRSCIARTNPWPQFVSAISSTPRFADFTPSMLSKDPEAMRLYNLYKNQEGLVRKRIGQKNKCKFFTPQPPPQKPKKKRKQNNNQIINQAINQLRKEYNPNFMPLPPARIQAQPIIPGIPNIPLPALVPVGRGLFRIY